MDETTLAYPSRRGDVELVEVGVRELVNIRVREIVKVRVRVS